MAVGRESKAHPAFCIISSLDPESYHLPPIQGDKYRFERNGSSLNKAKPQSSSRDRASPYGSGGNVTLMVSLVAAGAFQIVAAQGVILMEGCAPLSRPIVP